MPVISIYYLTLDNFAYPFLFFGLFLALLQFSFDAERNVLARTRGQAVKNKLKILISEMWIMWLIGVVFVGFYIIFKLVMSAVGWVAIQVGRPYLFGKEVPQIDSWIGIGSIAFLLLIVGMCIYLFIRYSKSKKAKSYSQDPIGEVNNEIRIHLAKLRRKKGGRK